MQLLLVVTLFVATAMVSGEHRHHDLVGSSERLNTTTPTRRPTQNQILRDLINNYDKDVRPNDGGPADEVRITMYLISISSVSESNMDYSVEMYLRHTWLDPRLAYDARLTSSLSVSEDTVRKHLWLPDTFIPGSKQTHFHVDTVPNTFLRISPNGTVFRSVRLSVTAICSMDLRHFPMDTHKCSLQMESYGHNMNELRYRWGNRGNNCVGISPGVELPHFTLLGYRCLDKHILLSSGNYSCLLVDFIFQRDLGFYMTRIYLPSATVVLLAWFSLWLRPGNGPTRLVLSVTSLIAMMLLMMGTVNDAVVKVSYITGIDIYLFSCFLLVVATLGEFVIVDFLDKRDTKRGTKKMDIAEPETDTKLSTGERVDKFGRIIVLAVFVMFNFLYWAIYLNVGDAQDNLIPFVRK